MALPTEWDQGYGQESLHRHEISTSSHLIRRRFELYHRVFAQAPGRDLLEVGCAPGQWLVTFAKEFGMNPTGIDFAPTGCAEAREALRRNGIQGEVLEGDFLEWDPGDRRYDVVFFQGSLEHFVDPVAGLRVALRATRPGGLILAQIPCLGSWHINGVLNRVLDHPDGLSDVRTRTVEEMERAFREAGILNIKSEQLGTFQLMLSERPNKPLWWRTIRWFVGFTDLAVGAVLNRTDLSLDLPGISPHALTWGVRPSDD